MTTLIDRTSMAAALGERIYMVTGHGVGLGVSSFSTRLPANTYVIFLSKPGQLLDGSSILTNPKLYNDPTYIRSVLTHRIPLKDVRPVRLAYWKKHLYGPGNKLPDVTIQMKDASNPLANRVAGVVNTSIPGTFLNYQRTATISQIVRRHGRGIYVIASCRASRERTVSGIANLNYRSNVIRTGGTQRGLRIGSMSPNVNRITQYRENVQRRLAKLKRNASQLSPPKTLPKKSRLFYSTFHPGVPSPPKKKSASRSTTSRRLATPRSTR